MEIFTRFNRKQIQDRQVDTLIGISKGLIADGKVDQSEAEFLLTWLAQSSLASDNPIIINLLEKLQVMLEDGVLDSDESAELFTLLHSITGDSSEFGELSKTTSLPINKPVPDAKEVNRNWRRFMKIYLLYMEKHYIIFIIIKIYIFF